MTIQEPLAFKVKKYTGPNPFTDSQARDYPLTKAISEFVPTSKYWNRFNVSNEILIGTRGSGKTILLKMMTYTSLLSLKKSPLSSEVSKRLRDEDVIYIGFYVPLRLRVLGEIGKAKSKEEERRRFSFLFNCACAGSLINEIISIINERFDDDYEKLSKERAVIDKLKKVWDLRDIVLTPTLLKFKEQIDELFNKVRFDWEETKVQSTFDSPLLEPIIASLPFLESIFCFDENNVTWMACFDEAEYLNSNLQRVLNTVMRSESGGLAVKIATLPFHYNEFQTEIDGEYVQPEGDDFRFESIDYSWDESEFITLTDRLVSSRLGSTRLFDEIPLDKALESFVGEGANKDLISIYRSVFQDASDEDIDKQVSAALRHSRKRTGDKYSSGQIKRYKPIYLLRQLFEKNKKGNSKVPRLSGALMIRRVSDGNVRRFIQICDIIFEYSRVRHLRPNAQHDAVMLFSKQRYERSKSVYRDGFLLYKIIDSISNFLFHKMYDGDISDVGVEFSVDGELLENSSIKSALEMGVAYSYFYCEKPDLFNGITSETKFRLANSVAAYKWLPMRAGGGVKISSRSPILEFLFDDKVLKPKVVEKLSLNLELDI